MIIFLSLFFAPLSIQPSSIVIIYNLRTSLAPLVSSTLEPFFSLIQLCLASMVNFLLAPSILMDSSIFIIVSLTTNRVMQ